MRRNGRRRVGDHQALKLRGVDLPAQKRPREYENKRKDKKLRIDASLQTPSIDPPARGHLVYTRIRRESLTLLLALFLLFGRRGRLSFEVGFVEFDSPNQISLIHHNRDFLREVAGYHGESGAFDKRPDVIAL